MSKKYPALYTTSTKGTFFKHCSINKTIYFELLMNEEEALKNSEYKEYMNYIQQECYDALVHKFITSQPLKVTNDRIPFVIFKSNADFSTIRLFCKAILDELYASTGIDPKAKYYETETIFVEINKTPTMLRKNNIGEKLTQRPVFKNNIEILEGSHEKIDSGIVTSFKEYEILKAEKEKVDDDEIVEW